MTALDSIVGPARKPALWVRLGLGALYGLTLLVASALSVILPFYVGLVFSWDNETGWWAVLGVFILLALMTIGPVLCMSGVRTRHRLGEPKGLRLQVLGAFVWILSWMTGAWGLLAVILTAVRGG